MLGACRTDLHGGSCKRAEAAAPRSLGGRCVAGGREISEGGRGRGFGGGRASHGGVCPRRSLFIRFTVNVLYDLRINDALLAL